MNVEEIQTKIGTVLNSKPEYKEFIQNVSGYKSSTNEVEFNINGEKKYVSLDELEKGVDLKSRLTATVDAASGIEQVQNGINPTGMQNLASEQKLEEVSAPVAPTPTVQTGIEQVQSSLNPIEPEVQVNETITPSVTPEVNAMPDETVVPTENVESKVTLNDIKTLADIGNKDTLTPILDSIAITPEGNVDMPSIIEIARNNMIDTASNAIIENRPVSTELYKYEKDGKVITPEEIANAPLNKDVNINNGFNNLSVYYNVAKLYGLEFTPEQIQLEKQNYINAVNDKVAEKMPVNSGLVEPAPELSQAEVEEQAKVKTLTPVPESTEKAGFIDIFILAVIVLVYAAIIVNLVLKLK